MALLIGLVFVLCYLLTGWTIFNVLAITMFLVWVLAVLWDVFVD
jgi:hypothetical protein